ncbi:glutathione S-transferase [Echinimonas agarilytica]|uniref:Glutathione S-transferase n=1 Tax=Echinimonas agarilytica TaxID=1215918 RepID=A0AA41W4G0_9GAMM|nr:glutathione S-transferase [Echinimonas agarilytica]MCM2678732.1 glutathione S-transferase [Echinimonas agarilytica]
MKLIGMLDSPFVRRVAISLQLLDIEFEHLPLSVFRDFDQFKAINPGVKAPTLICDDGQILMDSTLILEYAEAIRSSRRSLMPSSISEVKRALRVIGLAMVANEKSVQIYYEMHLRPEEKQHQPWVERVSAQLKDVYQLLENELNARPMSTDPHTLGQAGITTAVAWYFTQNQIPGFIDPADFPELASYSKQLEQLAEFKAASFHGDVCEGAQ